MHIASSARWDTQRKGLVELERRCQDLMQEVKLVSERQDVLAGFVEDKCVEAGWIDSDRTKV